MSLLIILLLIGIELAHPMRDKLHNILVTTLQSIIQSFDNQATLNSYLKILFFTLLPTAIIGFILIGLHITANNSSGFMWLLISLIYITISIIVLLCSLNNSYLINDMINYLSNTFGINLNNYYFTNNKLNSNNYSNNNINNEQPTDNNIVLNDKNNFSELNNELDNELEHLVNNNLNFFAVIWWYLVLNPAISLLYCLLEILAHNTFDIKTRLTAIKLLHILSWIPTRALGITLVFMGSFERSFKVFKSYLLDFDTPNKEIIYKIIFNAKETNITNSIITNIKQLYIRSIILWICVLTFYLYIKF